MFVMSLLNGRAMVAGRSTAANEIIQLAGAVNAIDGYEGYKPINDEAIVAAKPDVVLSIARGKDSVEADAVFAHPAFALTPAAGNKAFISMEGLYLLGFGPRTAAAARDLAVKLYPALAPQAEQFDAGGAVRRLPEMSSTRPTPRARPARSSRPAALPRPRRAC